MIIAQTEPITLSSKWLFNSVTVIDIPKQPCFCIESVLSSHNREPVKGGAAIYSGVYLSNNEHLEEKPWVENEFKEHFFGKFEGITPSTRIKIWNRRSTGGGTPQCIYPPRLPAGAWLEMMGPESELTLSQLWYLLATRTDIQSVSAPIRDKRGDLRWAIACGPTIMKRHLRAETFDPLDRRTESEIYTGCLFSRCP